MSRQCEAECGLRGSANRTRLGECTEGRSYSQAADGANPGGIDVDADNSTVGIESCLNGIEANHDEEDPFELNDQVGTPSRSAATYTLVSTFSLPRRRCELIVTATITTEIAASSP